MKHLVFWVFGVAVLALALLMFLPQNPNSTREIVFAVQKGEGTRDIALNLEKEGLVPSAPLFRLFVLTTGVSGKLQAGTYLFSPAMSPFEISRKLASGDIILNTITLPEGLNIRDIGFVVENKGLFQAEELWETAGFPATDYRTAADLPLPHDFSNEFPFLKDKPSYVGLEGYLFPDTYEVAAGERIEDVVRRMLSNFGARIARYENEIARQNRSLFEVLTIASLVEKEVALSQDRALVAGVLQNRLDIGMALQVDATLTYLTGPKERVSKEDTEIDSPFNTYEHPGLPPGPIANPSIESIEAALFPKPSPYYYYLSTKEGETIFSETLEEHNRAKAEHLR